MDDHLRILSTSGISDDALSSYNAYLGVSFSMTRYFSRSRMREYVDWAADNVRNLLIIVADHFEGYNIQVFKKSSPEEAFPRAFKAGYDLLKGYVRAIPAELRPRNTVVLASELLVNEDCQPVVAAVREAARTTPEFRRDCRTGIVELIAGRLDEAGLRGREREQALDMLHNYMYEEIAIILYVAHVMQPPWPLAIFPYPPRRVITNIYAGHYGPSLLRFTNHEPFRFVQLVSPSFEMEKAGR